MATPKGTRHVKVEVEEGFVFLYANDEDGIVLQLRRAIPTEDDMLSPSFKVAVRLDPSAAILVGSVLSRWGLFRAAQVAEVENLMEEEDES